MEYFLLGIGGFIRNINVFGLSYLEWVGLGWSLMCAFYFIPRIVTAIYRIWIAPIFGPHVDLRKMGAWAVVTGASDGIGKAYVEEIAKQGVNIVLISRTKSKLESVAKDIESQFGVETKTIAIDFTDGLHVYSTIEKELEGLEVGTLVNNIGIWYPFVEHFTELPNATKVSREMILCNVCPVTFLTHMFLPQMCSRRRGVIINVSSRMGTSAVPLASMYCATKVFTERLSESLAMECEKSGVIIQTCTPAYVATGMSGVTEPSWFTPSANDYVKKALKTIGIESRSSVHLPHRLARFADEVGYFFFREFDTLVKYHFFLAVRALSKRRLEYILRLGRDQWLKHGKEMINEMKVKRSQTQILHVTQSLN